MAGRAQPPWVILGSGLVILLVHALIEFEAGS